MKNKKECRLAGSMKKYPIQKSEKFVCAAKTVNYGNDDG